LFINELKRERERERGKRARGERERELEGERVHSPCDRQTGRRDGQDRQTSRAHANKFCTSCC
jgi:hypothetical protein